MLVSLPFLDSIQSEINCCTSRNNDIVSITRYNFEISQNKERSILIPCRLPPIHRRTKTIPPSMSESIASVVVVVVVVVVVTTTTTRKHGNLKKVHFGG